MSDTLADLSSVLPSQFLSGDIDDKTLFHNNQLFPYEFTSSSSTESESDDDDVTGLTRNFTRSLSLQERLKTPLHSHLQKKRTFSGSYETTPFGQTEDDALERIYAAAGHLARLKMKMMLMNIMNDDVYATRGILGAPFPFGPGPTLADRRHHPNSALWPIENEEFFRQQHFRRTICGGPTVGGRPVEIRQSTWPQMSVENQRRQQYARGFGVKPFENGYSRCGNGAVKKERAGTGVFLPRSYSNSIPEIKKKPACSPVYLPARVAQSFNKTMGPINPQPPNINAACPPQYKHLNRDDVAEFVIAAQQHQYRRSMPETSPIGPPEVVLPQEWTY